MTKHDRRQEIMRAAEELFTTRRFHEVTTDDIAHQAKVGKGTIYRYFQDKDELFFETATTGFDELCDTLENQVPQLADFDEQLLRVCEEVSEFFNRRRQLFRMVQESLGVSIAATLRDRWVQRRKRLVQAVAGVLSKGMDEGKVRDDVPAPILANFLLGMLRTRGRDLADVPEHLRSYELILELFRNGVARSAKPAARGTGDLP